MCLESLIYDLSKCWLDANNMICHSSTNILNSITLEAINQQKVFDIPTTLEFRWSHIKNFQIYIHINSTVSL